MERTEIPRRFAGEPLGQESEATAAVSMTATQSQPVLMILGEHERQRIIECRLVTVAGHIFSDSELAALALEHDLQELARLKATFSRPVFSRIRELQQSRDPAIAGKRSVRSDMGTLLVTDELFPIL